MALVAAGRHHLRAILTTTQHSFRGPPATLSSRHFSASASREENLKEAKKWSKITAAGFAVVISLTVYNFVNPEHHGEHDRPEYSYLHIRNKEFPWGPDGLFERKHHDD